MAVTVNVKVPSRITTSVNAESTKTSGSITVGRQGPPGVGFVTIPNQDNFFGITKNIRPTNSGVYTLGTDSYPFFDLHSNAATFKNNVFIGGDLSVTGNLNVSGSFTLGNETTDSITTHGDLIVGDDAFFSDNVNVTGDLTTRHIYPETTETYNLGSLSKKWDNIYARTGHFDESTLVLGPDGAKISVVNSRVQLEGTSSSNGAQFIGDTHVDAGTLFAQRAEGPQFKILNTNATNRYEFELDDNGNLNVSGLLAAGVVKFDNDILPSSNGGNIGSNSSKWNYSYSTTGVIGDTLSVGTSENNKTLNVGGDTNIYGDLDIYDENNTSNKIVSIYDSSDEGRIDIKNANSTKIRLASNSNSYFLNGNLGIGTSTPSAKLDINSTDAIKIPAGTTAQRPTASDGMLRYNSTKDLFEGYHNSSWQGLGGVIDADQDSYISTEKTSDDDTLYFYTSGIERAKINNNGDFNVASNLIVSGDLSVSGNFNLGDSTTDRITTQGDLYVKDDAFFSDAVHITGALTVDGTASAANPTQNGHLTTKTYVDSANSSLSSNLATTGTTLQNQITSNDSEITALNTATGSLQTQVTNNDGEISSLNSATGSLQSQVTNNDSEISALNTATGSLQTQVTSNDSDITALNTATGNLQSQVTANDSDITALNTATGSLQSQVTSNDNEISALNTATGSLQTQVTSNDVEITALNTATGSLQTQVTSNDSDISTLNTATGSLQGQVSSNDSDISTLTSNLSTTGQNLLSQITSNDSDVAALNTATGNLQTQVNNLSGDAVFVTGDQTISGVKQFAGNVTIGGDFTVNGTTTTVNTSNVLVEDPVLYLAKNQTGTPTVDAGFIAERGGSANVGFIWDESEDQFSAINTTEIADDNDITIQSYAALKAGNTTVSDLTSSDGFLFWTRNSSGTAAEIKQSGSGGILNLKNSSGTLIRVGNDGNLGVGNSSPSHRLDVTGTSRIMGSVGVGNNPVSNASLSIDRVTASTANDSVGLDIYNRETSATASKNKYGLKIASSGSDWSGTNSVSYGAYISSTTSNTSLNYGLYLSVGGADAAGGNIGIYVTGESKNYFSGNVGIGTSSPSYKLHVNGTSRFTSTLLSDGSVGIGTTNPLAKLHVADSVIVGRVNDVGTYAADDYDLFVGNGNNGATLMLYDDSSSKHSGLVKYDSNILKIGLNNSNTADTLLTTSALNITETGVGIGTDTPSVKLDINSTDAIKIPVGTTAQRPTAANGMLRLNTTTAQFEGYQNSAWQGLGGVIDVDQDTYISTEKTSDDDTLFFYTAGSERARLTSAGLFRFVDNAKATFGAGDDLQIYHDGSNSHIKDAGTGSLLIQATELVLENAAGSQNYLQGVDGGAVSLYYAGSTKLETTSTGVAVTSNISIPDNGKAIFGSNDLEIYHDSSDNNSYITEKGSGHLYIKATNLRLKSYSNGENFLAANENGAVSLYYDNAVKLATTSTGATVTGAFKATTILDTNNSAGTNGQVLVSTGSALDWKTLSEISGVDGTGTANYLPKWTDGDSIGNSVIAESSSKIGIGTAAPATLLHVYNNTALTPSELRIENATAGYNAALQIKTTASIWDVGSNITAAAGSFEVYERTSGSTGNRLTIRSGGSVGIGTSAPGAKLNVAGGAIRVDNTASTVVRLHLNNSGTNDYASIYADTAAAYKNLILNPSGGKVGIGTTSPDYKLHVAGDYIFVDSDKGIRFGGSSHQISRESSNELRLKSSNTTGFITFLTGSGSERMRIASDGIVTAHKLEPLNGNDSGYLGSSSKKWKQVYFGILGADTGTFAGNITQTTGDLLYSGGGNWDIKHTIASQNIVFSTTPSGGSATERLRITHDGHLSFLNDTSRIKMGLGGDLQIYHDGSNSHIKNTGPLYVASETSGDLHLRSDNDINLDSDNGYFYFKDGGTSVGLFKLTSSNFYIKSTVADKDIIFQGNDGGSTITALTLDMSAGGNAIFNDLIKTGNLSISGQEIDVSSGDLTLDVAGDIILDADSGAWRFKDNGGSIIELSVGAGSSPTFYSPVSNADILFRGNDGGSAITALTLDMSDAGTATFNHDIKLADNGKAIFGAGSDLEIYHDGSHSYISDVGSGYLRIKASNYLQLMSGDGEVFVNCEANGAVYLSYDNSTKLATTSTGVAVTGGVTATGALTFGGTLTGNSGDLTISNTAVNSDIIIRGERSAGTVTALTFDISDGGAATFSSKIQTGNLTLENTQISQTVGALVLKNFATDGNIVFTADRGDGGGYFDYFSVNGGDTTYSGGVTTAYTKWVDNSRIALGSGKDLQIYHDGSHSYIKDTGTGNLVLATSRLSINNAASNEEMISAIQNGAVELFYDNSKKLETTATGVTITGLLTATTKSFTIDHPTKPGKKLRYGSLEGPEHGVYTRGKSNNNKIELPEYWTKLVDKDSITVQLTSIGKPQQLYVERIENNIVYVQSEENRKNIKDLNYYYFVQAERIDVEKLQTEIEE